MATISQMNKRGVKYKGGFRGSYIALPLLIEHKIRLDILDFSVDESRVRNCDSYCRMQIRINGGLYVTWHSSEIMTLFLKDCKADETMTGATNFPLENCMVTIGDDRGYYLQDATKDAVKPSKSLLDQLVDISRRRR